MTVEQLFFHAAKRQKKANIGIIQESGDKSKPALPLKDKNFQKYIATLISPRWPPFDTNFRIDGVVKITESYDIVP